MPLPNLGDIKVIYPSLWLINIQKWHDYDNLGATMINQDPKVLSHESWSLTLTLIVDVEIKKISRYVVCFPNTIPSSKHSAIRSAISDDFLEAIMGIIWDAFLDDNWNANWDANCDANWDYKLGH